MSANKVILNGDVLIDLTEDTVVESDVLSGKTFHKANGEPAVGTSSGLDINGIVKQYKVNAGASVSAGDFVEFVTKYGSGEFSNETANEVSACKLDNQRVFISYRVSTYMYGVILKITDKGIIKGEETALANTAYSGLSAVALTSNKVLVVYGSVSGHIYYLKGCITEIEGNSVTTTLPISIENSDYISYTIISAVALTDNKVFIACKWQQGPSMYRLSGLVCVIGNEGITEWEKKVLQNSTTDASFADTRAVALTDSKVFIAYREGSTSNASSDLRIVACTINGTAITFGSSVRVESSGYGTAYEFISAVALSESKVLMAYTVYTGNDYATRIMRCTIEGTVVTKSAACTIETKTVSYAGVSAIALTDSKALVIFRSGSAGNYKLMGIIVTDTSSLSFGTLITIASGSAGFARTSLVAFSDTSALALSVGGASTYTGLTINGSAITVDETPATDGTFVQPATSNLFNVGVAKTSGTEGETVDVYCVE